MVGDQALLLLALSAMILLLFFITAFALLLLKDAIRRDHLLRREGVVTQGIVFARNIRFGGLRMRTYWVGYRFTAITPDGRPQRIEAHEKVWLPDYLRLVEGSDVCVEYIPESPGIARLRPMKKLAPRPGYSAAGRAVL